MEEMLSWGLWVIEAVQGLSRPWLDAVMKAISLLGDELFYLALLPLLFWCVDERKAFRLGTGVFLSTFLNVWLKGLFMIDRPFVRREDLGIGHATGFSTPSGHAQISATLWGGLALLWGGRVLSLLAFLFPLLIGFSRVYLGVHYPTDVFLGWALGALPVLLWLLFGKRLEALFPRLNVRLRIGLVAALAWLMCMLHRADVSAAAGFFGLALGWILNREKIHASATGPLVKRTLRFLLGASVMAGLYLGLKLILPGSDTPSGPLFRFIRYGLLGFWASAGAPWLFIKLGLAELRPRAEAARSL